MLGVWTEPVTAQLMMTFFMVWTPGLQSDGRQP